MSGKSQDTSAFYFPHFYTGAFSDEPSQIRADGSRLNISTRPFGARGSAQFASAWDIPKLYLLDVAYRGQGPGASVAIIFDGRRTPSSVKTRSSVDAVPGERPARLFRAHRAAAA